MSKKIVSEAEVKSVINQFPTYADYAKNIVSTLKDTRQGTVSVKPKQ